MDVEGGEGGGLKKQSKKRKMYEKKKKGVCALSHVRLPQQLQQHVINLQTEQSGALRPLHCLLNKLITHRLNRNGLFTSPVPMSFTAYHQMIPHPMDFTTIKQRLYELYYQMHGFAEQEDDSNVLTKRQKTMLALLKKKEDTTQQRRTSFVEDVMLVFSNAQQFNQPNTHYVHLAAVEMQEFFTQEMAKLQLRWRKKKKKDLQHHCHQCQGQTCQLCHEKCINFEPPLVECNGECGQRIRRLATYYTNVMPPVSPTIKSESSLEKEDEEDDSQFYWCNKCFPGLPKQFSVSKKKNKNEVLVVEKRKLVKLRFQDELTEPWVQCDVCNIWVHQICALFNSSLNEHYKYKCPYCRLKQLSVGGGISNNSNKKKKKQKISLKKEEFGTTTPPPITPTTTTAVTNNYMNPILTTQKKMALPVGFVPNLNTTLNSNPPQPSAPQMKLFKTFTFLQQPHPALLNAFYPPSPFMYHTPPFYTLTLQHPSPLIMNNTLSTQKRKKKLIAAASIAATEKQRSPCSGEIASNPATKKKLKKNGTISSNFRMEYDGFDSRNLRQTELSQFMEAWVAYHFQEEEKLKSSGQQERVHEILDSLTIRLVSSVDRYCQVHPSIQQLFQFAQQKFPETIGYTSKLVLVFQRIEGIEVCIFSMYIQEYRPHSLYVAYLDSLAYFRPRPVRTFFFQHFLIGYFAYRKLCKHAETVYIWACPPTRGGDFIYWCHPLYQKNPPRTQLIQWYQQMIYRGQIKHVIHKSTNLYSAVFEKFDKQGPTPDQSLPPLFEGDFWPGEAIRIMKNRVEAVSNSQNQQNTNRKRGRKSKKPADEPKEKQEIQQETVLQILCRSVATIQECLVVFDLLPKCQECELFIHQGEEYYEHKIISCRQCFSKHDNVGVVNEKRSCCEIGEEILTKIRKDEAKKGFWSDENGLSCTFLDDRSAMLRNCEMKHYQFDSLRRAKFSTMMLLYQLFQQQHKSSTILEKN